MPEPRTSGRLGELEDCVGTMAQKAVQTFMDLRLLAHKAHEIKDAGNFELALPFADEAKVRWECAANQLL
jgi:hypothetical protein